MLYSRMPKKRGTCPRIVDDNSIIDITIVTLRIKDHYIFTFEYLFTQINN